MAYDSVFSDTAGSMKICLMCLTDWISFIHHRPACPALEKDALSQLFIEVHMLQ